MKRTFFEKFRELRYPIFLFFIVLIYVGFLYMLSNVSLIGFLYSSDYILFLFLILTFSLILFLLFFKILFELLF